MTEVVLENTLIERFDQRFSRVPQSIYTKRFKQLLLQSHQRHQIELQGKEESPSVQPVESDIRIIRAEILSKIDQTDQLPSLPVIVSKLDAILSSPDANAHDVAETVKLDPAIASRVLYLSNSPLFPLTRKVETLEHAVAYLGLKGIRKIVLMASVMNTFSSQETTCFSPKKFWRHSVAVAYASSLIVQTLKETDVTIGLADDEAFLAGLLHDIGKIAMADHFQDELIECYRLANDEGLDLFDAELVALGVHHTDLGHRLLQRWGLSDDICLASLSHHEPATTGTSVYVVHLADALAHGLGFSADEDLFPRLDPRVWSEVQLADQVIERIGFEVLKTMEEVEATLNV